MHVHMLMGGQSCAFGGSCLKLYVFMLEWAACLGMALSYG